ncbi:hypothetical protein BKA81DRAFT_69857 [Phyllosticta paracitricarpa]|uniref:Transmembrane protein 42 n=1 Tax=Phyllosticta paracitricarpa TaxID=2016321 RepID=A0ABR1N3F5_9PEZI
MASTSSASRPLPSHTKPKPAATWLVVAIASGACAAFNGVFAKLTTTTLTSSWASGVSHLLGLGEENKVVEFAVRGFFFLLNLLFNAIMWALFTRALTLASSTVRVSIINTSANFMLTALLGALIFSEALPGIWWLGAAMLVAGSVVIGRRDGGTAAAGDGDGAKNPTRRRRSEDVMAEGEAEPFLDEPSADARDGASGAVEEVELEPVDEDVDGVLAGPRK